MVRLRDLVRSRSRSGQRWREEGEEAVAREQEEGARWAEEVEQREKMALWAEAER